MPQIVLTPKSFAAERLRGRTDFIDKIAQQAAFSRRLIQACDECPNVPEHGKGRQVALGKALKVSQEAVRKWLVGESLPRPEKTIALAKFLNVDHVWLALGTSPSETVQKRQVSLRGDAAVYGVMSYLMLAGYNVAIPPTESKIDIYAIKHGTQLAVAARMGEPLAPRKWRLIFPTTVDASLFAVIASDERTLHLSILEVPLNLALTHGQRTGAGVEIVVTKSSENDFKLDGIELRQFGSPWTER